MPTIEERALALVNEVAGFDYLVAGDFMDDDRDYMLKALCRALEAHDAERAAHAQFRQEVSDVARDAVAMLDEMAKPLLMGRNVKERLEKARSGLAPLIIPKPDPLVEVFEEIHGTEVREGQTWSEVIAKNFRAALAARGIKLVEVGDAD